MVKDGKLPNKQEYLEMWVEEYKATKPKSIEGDTEEVINNMALFDYYCYITLVEHVYGEEFDDKTYEISKIKEFDPNALVEVLKEYFKRPNTSLEKKARVVYEYIREKNIDIMFIQEGETIKW